ncbi:nuclear pore complex protein NUP1 [Humulus lupulus]|uniref:nuclear pore complex protein NUP1 n=1 Tax=Humulus lupulus TaxID=3486 RepID=UPI002B4123B0|nr:nuclear pore complex protein NUP1 [Humulus lupulus]
METCAETTSYGEQRGAGGKLKRPTRKPPSTPYSRPPAPPSEADRGQRRWLSKLVDPACRLITGGASLFFPTFFSKSPTIPATSEHHENQEAEIVVQEEANGDNQNDIVNHELSRTTGVVGPERAADVSENISDLVLHNQDKGDDLPYESGLSEIEKLLKGKKFSRDEVNHLMLIINSRAAEVPNVDKEKEFQSTASGVAAVSHEIVSTPSDRNQRDFHGSLWKTSTPLPKSAMPDDVCASPIDIAKAYMGSRTLETGNSAKGMILKDERSSLYGADFVSKPFISSPSPKPSACWPGAMLQDERDHLTPQSQSGRYGLHNFPRTPYSRTIFSKSKSKLTHSQGDNDKWMRPSTSLQTSQTPVYGQVNSRSNALEDNHGSIGPVRRSRNRFSPQTPGTQHRLATQTPGTQHRLSTQSPGTQTPLRGSGFEPSLIGPSRVENSSTSQGFLPAFKRSVEPRETISGSQFRSADRKNHSSDVGVPTVHPHSSQIARTILDHIDRNPPTPKDKSQELRLAFEWKKPASSSVPSINSNEHTSKNSLLNVTGLESHKILNDQNKPAQDTSDKSNSLFMFPRQESTVTLVDTISNPRSNVFLSHGVDGVSQIKNSHEEVTKITPSQVVNLQKKPAASGTKPLLANISIDKPNSNWKFSSNQSSGFTFPVSTVSGVSSEPPTPSIMPSFSANSQHQPKHEPVVPSYTFGSSTTTMPSLVFSFPSTSSSAIQNDTSDIKFSFGSDKPRLSFGSMKKDAICY